MTNATAETETAATMDARRADAAAGQAIEQSRTADLEFALAAREAHLTALWLESAAPRFRARADRLLDDALRAADLARYHVWQAAIARRRAAAEQGEG